ncbi:hypothetical protein [Demequina salsinemoris]|uniref:hypothetical protein n=1 Tax=Demequina salsinemoris TaxID=577470 RepID=UPI000785FC8F|nr:hypothetical protein [Demequina salsinemoris]
MRLLRTVLSALCILAGAVSILGWAVGGIAVDAVEDGTAVVGFTERAVSAEPVQEALAGTVTDEVLGWLEEQGVSFASSDLEDTLDSLFESLVGSDLFQDLVVAQAEDSRRQIAEALTDESREAAPLVLEVEVDSLLADQLTPVVGSLASRIDIAPVEIVVMDADTFEHARTAYKILAFLAQYGLWLGIGLVVAGLLVSPRRAWFLPKLLLAVGVMSLLAWGALTFMGVDAVVALVPGGDDGALTALVSGVLSEDSLPTLEQRTLWVGLGALAGAVVLGLLARALSGRR